MLRTTIRRAASIAAIGALTVGGTLFAPLGANALTPAQILRADFLDHSASARIMTTAHTGAWRSAPTTEAPENSIASVQNAIDVGADILEIDIRRTSDGQLVLMHDETVDRTTNGTGRVDQLTLSALSALRLQELRGGDGAALTTQSIPTLAQVFATAKDKILINVDKAWPLRDDVYAGAVAAGVIDQILFKSDAPVAEVNSFLTAHPDILYCHVLTTGNSSTAHTFVREPDCYEAVWASPADITANPTFLAGLKATSRLFMNTMWEGLSGTYTDEESLINPANGWGHVVGLGANIIQTDDPAAVRYWIAGGNPVNFDKPAGAVRVQAEDYGTGGAEVSYHDNSVANQGTGLETYRPGDQVDLCKDRDGNQHVCWIRAGEWLKYTVTVPASGNYAIRVRVSSKYATPAGVVRFEFPGWTSSNINIRSTTGNQYFLPQTAVSSQYLTAGTQTFTVRIVSGYTSNFNLDWIQLEPR